MISRKENPNRNLPLNEGLEELAPVKPHVFIKRKDFEKTFDKLKKSEREDFVVKVPSLINLGLLSDNMFSKILRIGSCELTKSIFHSTSPAFQHEFSKSKLKILLKSDFAWFESEVKREKHKDGSKKTNIKRDILGRATIVFEASENEKIKLTVTADRFLKKIIQFSYNIRLLPQNQKTRQS